MLITVLIAPVSSFQWVIRDILMTLKNHSWTHSPVPSLQVICSFMHTSRPVMKTSHFHELYTTVLFVCHGFVFSPWELHSYMPVHTWYSFFMPHSIWICTDTNAVTTSSKEFSEQADEQWQNSELFSLKRHWWDDSTFSWASLDYCMEAPQLWLTAHCSSPKTAG